MTDTEKETEIFWKSLQIRMTQWGWGRDILWEIGEKICFSFEDNIQIGRMASTSAFGNGTMSWLFQLWQGLYD